MTGTFSDDESENAFLQVADALFKERQKVSELQEENLRLRRRLAEISNSAGYEIAETIKQALDEWLVRIRVDNRAALKKGP